MDVCDRAELLRKRYKAIQRIPINWKATASKPSGKSMRKPKERSMYPYGPSLCEKRSTWLETPDSQPRQMLKPKRIFGVSPLTRIAAQFPYRKQNLGGYRLRRV
jgi:hypothetical protein